MGDPRGSPVPLRRRMGSDHLVSALGPWQPITRNFTLRDGYGSDTKGGTRAHPGWGITPATTRGGSIPPASPVGPWGGQGTVAGVLSTTRRVTADTQDGRARCRAGVCGCRCLQCHIGVGGGQLLIQGHVGPGRGVSEGGRGCTAQREGKGPPRPPATAETMCRSSGCSPLAKATTSQTVSEALACRSKTQRGLSSAKVVAVTFPGSAVGGTQGT